MYALLMQDRDAEARDELDQSLYAPPGWTAQSAAKLNLMLRGG